MAAKGSLPSYLGGGMPALGYFTDFMPGQQAALAQQLGAAYAQPTTNKALEGPKKDGYTGSRGDWLYELGAMYSPMGSAIPKPAPKPAPVVVAPKPTVRPKLKPTMPKKRPTRYVSSRW